jgi:hypothetical protein
VRHIFQRYCEVGSVRLLKAELDRDGLHSKLRVARNGSRSGSQSFSRGALYTLLRNPIYSVKYAIKARDIPDSMSQSSHASYGTRLRSSCNGKASGRLEGRTALCGVRWWASCSMKRVNG